MANGPREVVDEVEGGVVRLHLPGDDGLAARLVRPRAEAGVIHADHGLDVVRGVQGLLKRTGRHTRERLALRGFRPVKLNERMALNVRRRPLGRVGLERTLAPDERGLGGQRDQFGRGGPPVVEHPLGVLRPTDQAAEVPLALEVHLGPIDRDDRDIPPGPVHRVEDFGPAHDVLADPMAVHVPRALDAHADQVKRRLVGLVVLHRDHGSVRQQEDGPLDLLPDPVFRDLDEVAVHPRRPNALPGLAFPVDLLGARIGLLERRLRHLVGDVAVGPVGAVGARAVAVWIHRQRVRDPLDHDVLVEGVVGGVARVDAEVAEAAEHRVFEGRVIGHLGVAGLLDVADQAVEDLGGLRVGLAVHRHDADAGLVPPGVVHDLAAHAHQLVHRQAGPAFKFPVPAHPLGPLVLQQGEVDIVLPRLAVGSVMLGGLLKAVEGFLQQVGLAHDIQPPCTA